jgi:4-hydroxy-tetrahydrodipicolinate synthase
MVTPLLDRDVLDVGGLEKLLEHILAGGVGGLFILGTTGEGPSLSYRLRRELIERVCRQVNHRVPILVGITDTAFVESVNLARFSADCGADAVVAAPPYYMPEGQPELQEWLDHLLPAMPLPFFLYNMPPLTKVAYELDTVRHALKDPRIIGFKDSSCNMDYFTQVAALLPERPDWSLFIGPEEKLIDALRVGAHGGVSGGANLFPKLYTGVCTAFQAGDLARAELLQKQILRVSSALYRVGKHPSTIIKGIKCSLACLGICNDFMAEPFHRFRADERALVQSRLQEITSELSQLGVY